MERSWVEDALRVAVRLVHGGDVADAWTTLRPLLDAAETDVEAARWLARLLRYAALDRERRRSEARRLVERWGDDTAVLAALGEATQDLVDRRWLNARPPDDPLFTLIASGLLAAFDDVPDDLDVASGLATAARVCGRTWDPACERAHRRLLERRPDRWQDHYDVGLFLKNRGRFAEGADANRAAERLGGAGDESVVWNLGICATAIGDGETALRLWRSIGCKLELGADGLPAGTWHHVQVRLAQRPVAARGADDDSPGLEETVWIERLSPCHGRIVNALHQGLGVDYGDLVLFDGAPIVEREIEGRTVPVFPQLVALGRGGWRTLPFAATQSAEGQVGAIELGPRALLYVHTEEVRTLCRSCWEQAGQGHAHAGRPHRAVTGKLVLAPDAPPDVIAAALARATTGEGGPRVYVPELWSLAGDERRAEIEARRYAMLAGASAA